MSNPQIRIRGGNVISVEQFENLEGALSLIERLSKLSGYGDDCVHVEINCLSRDLSINAGRLSHAAAEFENDGDDDKYEEIVANLADAFACSVITGLQGLQTLNVDPVVALNKALSRGISDEISKRFAAAANEVTEIVQ